MYGNLDVLQTATAMARNAAQRQALVAANVANADTPAFGPGPCPALPRWRPCQPADHQPRGSCRPNGNTVSVEAEMLDAIEAGANIPARWRSGAMRGPDPQLAGGVIMNSLSDALAIASSGCRRSPRACAMWPKTSRTPIRPVTTAKTVSFQEMADGPAGAVGAGGCQAG